MVKHLADWAALFFVCALAVYGFGRCVETVAADHNIYLPMAGQTWMAQQIKTTQEQVWCLDAKAKAYPQFEAQLRDVNDQYTARVGIKHRQVEFGDPACQIQHLMGPEFPCGSGAAACIYYANAPVLIHYQESLGYQDWRSAHGHELGHGILGQLHERYRDSGGTIACGGTAEVGLTVMQCGPPNVAYPQPLDVQRGCAIIATSWCGNPPPPPPSEWGDCHSDAEGRTWCWNNFDQLWHWTIWEPTEWRFDPNNSGRGWYCVAGCP